MDWIHVFTRRDYYNNLVIKGNRPWNHGHGIISVGIHQTKSWRPGLEIPPPLKIVAWWVDDLEEKGFNWISLGHHLQLPMSGWSPHRRLARDPVQTAPERAWVRGGRAEAWSASWMGLWSSRGHGIFFVFFFFLKFTTTKFKQTYMMVFWFWCGKLIRGWRWMFFYRLLGLWGFVVTFLTFSFDCIFNFIKFLLPLGTIMIFDY